MRSLGFAMMLKLILPARGSNAGPDAVGYYEKMGWDAYAWDAAELTGIAADCTQMTKALLHRP